MMTSSIGCGLLCSTCTIQRVIAELQARQMSVIGQLDNGFDFENRSNSLQMLFASWVM